MNKKLLLVLLALFVCGIDFTYSQRLLPYAQNKTENKDDDVVGTWKWFCDSIVTVKNNGEVKAVWADGKREEGRFDRIGDNKYRFNWGHNEWIDILKLKQQGNILEGTNQKGFKVTANRISHGDAIQKNESLAKKSSDDPFYLNFLKSLGGNYAYKPYENGYHKGVITVLEKDEKGIPKVYQWKNEAGIIWKLFPTEKKYILRTDDANPYYKENRHFQFILSSAENGELLSQPLGFIFNCGMYWFEK